MANTPDPELLFDQLLEQVLEQQRRGQPIDIGPLVARCPEHAAALQSLLEDSTFLEPFFECTSPRANAQRPPVVGSNSEEASTLDDRGDGEFPAFRDFRILQELGCGSQGVVYKALQTGTERMVALKVIRQGLFASIRERLRFDNEIRVAAQLTHPNIVAIYGSGTERGRHFFSMQYIEGEPLDLYLSTRTLSLAEIVQLFLRICDAVAYAHQQGIIHRDLKPANILICATGQPHVLDFGLAKRLDAPENTAITQVGNFAGTWCYASPEQVRGDSVRADVRSDVYALGVLLYEAVTDAFPYPIGGTSSESVSHQILNVEPLRPTLIRRDVGDELEAIILRTLQKDPDRRYQSAGALREDLRRLLAGEPIEAKRDSALYLLRKKIRVYRRWVAAAIVVVGMLLAFSVTITFLYSAAQSARATSEARAEFSRRGFGFLLRQTAELSQLRNALALVSDREPDHPAVQRLARPFMAVPTTVIESLFESIPGPLAETKDRRNPRELDLLRSWLTDQGDTIEQLTQRVIENRLSFETETAGSTWLLAHHPLNWYPAQQLCRILTLSAVAQAAFNETQAAASSLTAARSVALDLADGTTLMHRDAALNCRRETYASVLAILETSWKDEEQIKQWATWLSQDPPLPTLRDTVATEAIKAFQIVEGAIRETRADGPGHLELAILDQLTEGLFSQLGLFADSDIEALESVTPTQMLAALDRFVLEIENKCHSQAWDGQEPQSSNQIDSPAFRLLNPLLPSFEAEFRYQNEVAGWRDAANTACDLCLARLTNGHWPRSLSEIGDLTSTRTNRPKDGSVVAYKLTFDVPQLELQRITRPEVPSPQPANDTSSDIVVFCPNR